MVDHLGLRWSGSSLAIRTKDLRRLLGVTTGAKAFRASGREACFGSLMNTCARVVVVEDRL